MERSSLVVWWKRPGMQVPTVTSLARPADDPGGIAGFIRPQTPGGEAAGPPVAHVPWFAWAVPSTVVTQRKAVVGGHRARFGGSVPKVASELEQLAAVRPDGVSPLGCRAGRGMSRQPDSSQRADLVGVRPESARYEAQWRLPPRSDRITHGKVEVAVAHLVQMVRARLALP